MFQRNLKALRLVISLLFFVATIALFIDFRELVPESWHHTILYLQFIPSLIKFIQIAGLAAAGFVVIILVTVVSGRVYCSTVCPLGILQDIFSYISKKLKIRKRYKRSASHGLLRYVFLALPLILLLAGSMFLVNLLDPYSNFGRISGDLIRPVVVGLNNVLAFILEKFGVYSIYPVTYKKIHWATLWFPSGLLILVFWMSAFHGRLFCNTVCPVGTALGLLSKVSVFKIKIDNVSCTKCGNCIAVCKSGCINIKTLNVDFDRCVACFNCIRSCDSDSIRYHNVMKCKPDMDMNTTDHSKRAFLSRSLIYMLGIAGLSKGTSTHAISTNKKSNLPVPENKEFPVTPPGSLGIRHFKEYCTACHLCISVCPTHVLQPSFLEYGFTGMMIPHMDFHTSYCNYECTKCGEVCPTGAILSLTTEAKKLTQTGRVKFIIDNCVVHTNHTACGSCSEHCPTQAVRMVPFKDGLTIPETHPGYCVGCGACEFACPVRPFRAIYVDGNKEHKNARSPEFEKLKIDEPEDFPF